MKTNMKSWAVGLGLLGTAALALAQTAAPEAAATVAEAAAGSVAASSGFGRCGGLVVRSGDEP